MNLSHDIKKLTEISWQVTVVLENDGALVLKNEYESNAVKTRENNLHSSVISNKYLVDAQ